MDVAALACARLLLQYGAEDGQTALAMAARMGSVPLVELLLTYGAEVNLADKVRMEGQVVLGCVLSSTHPSKVRCKL
eukprot:1161661-Pelagomonas_calceolata.AAC.3